MSLRALLYRRPSEPSGVQVVFDKADLSRALAPASAGASLHAAHRCGFARGRAHHAAARQRARRQRNSRRSTAAGSRRGSSGCRRRRRLHTAPRCRCAACRIASFIVAARAARCGPKADATATGCSASPASRRTSIAASTTSSSARRARDLEAASRRYAGELGVAVKRISVRDQSSRWGSCSNTGVLSFSWRLILAPPFVLDYLAAHEVCHLVELNHSPRFWRLVSVSIPTSSAPRSGSTCTAPNCTATACPPPARRTTFEWQVASERLVVARAPIRGRSQARRACGGLKGAEA